MLMFVGKQRGWLTTLGQFSNVWFTLFIKYSTTLDFKGLNEMPVWAQARSSSSTLFYEWDRSTHSPDDVSRKTLPHRCGKNLTMRNSKRGASWRLLYVSLSASLSTAHPSAPPPPSSARASRGGWVIQQKRDGEKPTHPPPTAQPQHHISEGGPPEEDASENLPGLAQSNRDWINPGTIHPQAL